VLGNDIFQARTKGVGPLPTEVALSYGVTGPALQATGMPEDSRVTEPYLKYGEIDVHVPVGENGDSFDRFACLLYRVEASLDIIDQIHDHLPAGPVNTKLPKMVKAPEGATYVRTENPLGQLGYWLESDGGRTPWRLKMRTPVVLQRAGDPLSAAGRAGAGCDRRARQRVLRRGGHRPMTDRPARRPRSPARRPRCSRRTASCCRCC
jgi:NADH:ubiquinone oxidoreductase subunit D